MGRIERDKDGNLAVAVENESDAAQLRATIKASDGADEIAVQAGKTVTFTAENSSSPRFADRRTDVDTSIDSEGSPPGEERA
ncbi:MAG: hypothetical protein ABL998_09770 [Planctomycetota bacterium]